VIWSAKYEPKQVLDADSAAIMTWMLRNVVTSGTGGEAQLNDRQVAGKTGTSDESRDLWFIGYIPQVVAGVWLGNDNNNPTYGNSSSAAYAWNKFMEEAVKGMSVEKFPPRPKLENRKGTIKAERIKPKKLINRSIKNDDQKSDEENTNDSRSSTRRRRRRTYSESESSESSENRPRRRRRYSQEESNTTPSSSRSRRRSSEESRSAPAKSSSSRRRSSPESSSSASSWRERLKPKSSGE